MLVKGNIRLPELPGKFKIIHIFRLLSMSIIILIIKSHVELDNVYSPTNSFYALSQFLANFQLIFSPINSFYALSQFSTHFQLIFNQIKVIILIGWQQVYYEEFH